MTTYVKQQYTHYTNQDYVRDCVRFILHNESLEGLTFLQKMGIHNRTREQSLKIFNRQYQLFTTLTTDITMQQVEDFINNDKGQ